MDDTVARQTNSETKQAIDSERTKQVLATGWTAGVFAVVACATLLYEPTWPVAFGIAAVAAMVAIVCFCMLRQ